MKRGYQTLILVLSVFLAGFAAAEIAVGDVISAPSQSSGKAETGEEKVEEQYRMLRAEHAGIINGLKKANLRMNDVVRFCVQANRIKTARPVDREKYEALLSEFASRYGFTEKFLPRDKPGLYITDRERIGKRIAEGIAWYEQTAPENCFRPDMTFVPAAACLKSLADAAGRTGYGIEKGRLYYRELTPEMEIRKVAVDDPLSGSGGVGSDTEARRHDLLFLTLASRTAPDVPTASLAGYPDHTAFDDLPADADAAARDVRLICIDKAPQKSVVAALVSLHEGKKDDQTINAYQRKYAAWKSACDTAVGRACRAAFPVKGTVILSYPSVACEVRDVTKKDVQNDIAGMETEADRLKHSTLLDEVVLCQSAYDAGYRWQYQKPALSEECRAEKKGKKRKKSKQADLHRQSGRQSRLR